MMWYSNLTNQYIQPNTAFSINGLQYPDNWLQLSTPQQRAELGLIEVLISGAPKDERFYFNNQQYSGSEVHYISTPRDIESIKPGLLSEVDQLAGQARGLCLSTGDFILSEYAFAYEDAKAFAAANFAEPAPASVQCWADVANSCNIAAANEIIAKGDALRASFATIRAARLKAKQGIKDAANTDELIAAYTTGRQELLNLITR